MKRYVLCLIIGILIGAVGTVGASETVQAVFSKFNIIVNGETQRLDTDPLVYNGTTYLPLRTAANMLGYDVTYKADSKTIELREVKESVSKLMGDDWIDLKTLTSMHKIEIHPGNTIVIDDEISIYLPDNMDESSGIVSAKTNKGNTVNIKINQSTTYLKLDDLQSIGIAN